MYQVTDDLYDNYHPVWAGDEHLLFITEKSQIANVDIVDLLEQNRATVTKLLSGVHSFDYHFKTEADTINGVPTKNTDTINGVPTKNTDTMNGAPTKNTDTMNGVPTNGDLIFSVYHENAWDVFTISNPLDDLAYYAYPLVNTPKTLGESFHSVFGTDSFRLYGKPKKLKPWEIDRVEPEPDDTSDTITGDSTSDLRSQEEVDAASDAPTKRQREYTARDFLEEHGVFQTENRPDSTSFTEPIFKEYKPRFSIDMLWGGMAYSPGYGAVGMLQLSLSDLMGDHGIGVSMEFNGEISDSNIVASYMYLPYRVDFGVAAFNYFDYQLYRDRRTPDLYYEHRKRQTGGIFLLQYPLSRFFRLDFQNSLYRYGVAWQKFDENYDEIGEEYDKKSTFVYLPQFGFVFDNALYGSTGPMSGNKITSFVRSGISKPEYAFTTFYSDWRGYLPMSHRFSLAGRAIYGVSDGNNPEQFNLWGFSGVRGFNDDYEYGRKKALASVELRYPFIDRLDIILPLPLRISNLRGSIFIDAGTVWDVDKEFIGGHKGRLQDIKFGYGFGPRVNLGIFILKFDIGWSSNWSYNTKPSYYITINEDF